MTQEERAKKIADAIITIMQGKSKPASTGWLSEYYAELRHRMSQAQKLKR